MPPHAGKSPTNSTTTLPIYQSVLLSISGDSKISLQHTSVQALGTIPEGREVQAGTGGTCRPGHGSVLDQADQLSLAPSSLLGGPGGPILIDDDQFDEPHVLVADPAPDGGYGWVIVLASFMCNLIVDGIAYTFGLFFEIFMLHFGTSKGKVALCGALLNGFYLGAGPIVSSLANRYGCRYVTILGSVIACIALILSTAAPNIETLMVTYGVIGGIGFGMIYLPAIVSVGYYFTSKRALATGMAISGSGVGTFLFAPFCQYLLSVTSWQNVLFLLALLVLCCSAFGALMRPLDIHAEAVLEDEDEEEVDEAGGELRKPLLQRIAEEKRRRLLANSNSSFLLMMANGSIDVHDPSFNELKARLTMNMEPGVHSTLYLDQLFNQSSAHSPAPTPSPTPTPSMYYPSSVNQSLMTLEKHQLSPIMEKKVVSYENLSEETLNQLTVTTVVEVEAHHRQKLEDVFKSLEEDGEEKTEDEQEGDKKGDEEADKTDEQLEEEEEEEDDFKSFKSSKKDDDFSCTSLMDADDDSRFAGDDDLEDGDRLTLKSELIGSPAKNSVSIYPSTQTLPQSPTYDTATSVSTAALAHSGRATSASYVGNSAAPVFRSRRSNTVRSQTSATDSVSLAPGSTVLHPATPTNFGASGQIPVQVILSSGTPVHSGGGGAKDGAKVDSSDAKSEAGSVKRPSSQTIHVRPLSKKDIFYQGSTLHIPNSQLSLSHQCSSHVSIAQSMVSIPARDIIQKVQKQIARREREREEADALSANGGVPGTGPAGAGGPLRQQSRNFCAKVVKIICPFKADQLDCYRRGKGETKQLKMKHHHLREEAEEDDAEMAPDEDVDCDETDEMAQQVMEPEEEDEPRLSCFGKLKSKLPPSMASILSEMLDVSLLRDSSAFTILAISNIFGMMGFYVPFMYITQFVSSSIPDGESGEMISKESAAMLISVIGITNTVGRLLFGFISDRIARTGTFAGLRMTALGLNNVCVFLSGLTVMAIPWCTTYTLVLVDCVLFGLFVSAYICLTSIILVDMLGLDKLTNAFGLLCLFRGAASMLGPPVAGSLFDLTDSYKITFGASGLLLIFAAVMAFFIHIREHTVDQEPDGDCDAA